MPQTLFDKPFDPVSTGSDQQFRRIEARLRRCSNCLQQIRTGSRSATSGD
jgi:hypothetical protein